MLLVKVEICCFFVKKERIRKEYPDSKSIQFLEKRGNLYIYREGKVYDHVVVSFSEKFLFQVLDKRCTVAQMFKAIAPLTSRSGVRVT
jgi:hypothetical protein